MHNDNKSLLPESVFEIEGISGNKTRHLYNNMCRLPGATYLEVGTWKGSSFISALHQNKDIKAFCVDHWSEFGGKDDFITNLNTHLPDYTNYKIIDKNCWNLKHEDLDKKTNRHLYV